MESGASGKCGESRPLVHRRLDRQEVRGARVRWRGTTWGTIGRSPAPQGHWRLTRVFQEDIRGTFPILPALLGTRHLVEGAMQELGLSEDSRDTQRRTQAQFPFIPLYSCNIFCLPTIREIKDVVTSLEISGLGLKDCWRRIAPALSGLRVECRNPVPIEQGQVSD